MLKQAHCRCVLQSAWQSLLMKSLTRGKPCTGFALLTHKLLILGFHAAHDGMHVHSDNSCHSTHVCSAPCTHSLPRTMQGSMTMWLCRHRLSKATHASDIRASSNASTHSHSTAAQRVQRPAMQQPVRQHSQAVQQQVHQIVIAASLCYCCSATKASTRFDRSQSRGF